MNRAWIVAVGLMIGLGQELHAQGLSFELLGVTQLSASAPGIESRISELSGLAYLPSRGTWLAVSDTGNPALFELAIEISAKDGPESQPGAKLRVEVRAALPLELPVSDAEGICVSPDERYWFIASEKPPSAVRVNTKSWKIESLPVPEDVVSGGRSNRMFESIAYVEKDGGDEVWLAVENALLADGSQADATRGTRCRVLIFNAQTLVLKRQAIYETEPTRGGLMPSKAFNSLADAMALPDGRVLFLERGFALPWGVHATIFVCDGATRSSTRGAGIDGLIKHEAIDLADLGVGLLANLEGIGLGPKLEGEEGGHLMVIVADDNQGDDGQVGTQIIALRVTGID